ncbi:MAG TPA: hypothetical protein VK810_01725, partial [Dongiaceae bacterium]|nr:hypothetical protein [Dongiaceae bacterium]
PRWQLWNDPEMKPFRDNFFGKWNDQFAAPIERDLGVKLADFKDLPQGQITFAVTQNGWNGIDDDKAPGILLLLDAKDKSDLLKTNLAALQKKWTDAGKPIRTEIIHGIKFSIVTLSSNDIPASLANILPHRQPVQELGKETKPEKPGELVVGQFESLLIAGNSIKAVEPVAAHLTGGAMPSLNDNAIFAVDKISRFHDAPLFYGWFNAKTLFNVLAQIPPPQPNPEAPSPMPQIPWDKVLAASGLAGLKSASLSYNETHDGSQINVFISAPEASRDGIFKMISAAPKSASPPPFVPADAMKFWRWRLDGQKTWATFEKMLGEISPAALSSLDIGLDMANATEQQKDPAFDIRKNLIGNLTDDLMSYQKIPTAAAPDNSPSLFLFGAANANQAAFAVNGVAGLLLSQQSSFKPRDFLGRKIYTIPLPSSRTAGGTAPAAPSFSIAANGDYVAMTTDIPMLEEYLRNTQNPGRPLSGIPGLADAAAHVGGAGGGLFGYENQRESMRGVFAQLKKSTSGTAKAGALNGLGSLALQEKTFRDLADFSLLPDYDKVSKYFYFSVYAGNTTADGISFKLFAPRPPQLN